MKVTRLLVAMGFVLAFALASASATTSSSGPVLFIGDSHSVGDFGWSLDELLRQGHGDDVWSYSSCGSSPGSWLSPSGRGRRGFSTRCGFRMRKPNSDPVMISTERVVRIRVATNPPTYKFVPMAQRTPLMATISSRLKPKLTVIALGTNVLWNLEKASGAEEVRSQVDGMLGVANRNGGGCAWVGPPDLMRTHFGAPMDHANAQAMTRKFYGILREEVAKYSPSCRVIDSVGDCPSVRYPPLARAGVDGIHYKGQVGSVNLNAEAQAWARCVYEKVEGLPAGSVAQPRNVPARIYARSFTDAEMYPPSPDVQSAPAGMSRGAAVGGTADSPPR